LEDTLGVLLKPHHKVWRQSDANLMRLDTQKGTAEIFCQRLFSGVFSGVFLIHSRFITQFLLRIQGQEKNQDWSKKQSQQGKAL
jgi:hypothetical protein